MMCAVDSSVIARYDTRGKSRVLAENEYLASIRLEMSRRGRPRAGDAPSEEQP